MLTHGACTTRAQPNCGEPWLESVWEEPALGKVQLLAIPLLKLTNAKEAKVTALVSAS